MLRLPDPESEPTAAQPARRGPGRSAAKAAGSARRKPVVHQVPDLDPDPDPGPALAPTPVDRAPAADAAGAARNPLFRAIDGGLADPGPEEAPRPRRGSARRARPAATARRVTGARSPRPDADAGERLRPECYGCPVGVAFGTVREASPETLDHLVAASRELVSAARSVMEALEVNLDRHSRRAPVQHIELD